MIQELIEGEPTVECKYCGTLTNMCGTKLCDRCWELEKRIRNDIDLAKKILDRIEHDLEDLK